MYLENTDFTSMEIVQESRLACIGAPLLCRFEVQTDTTDDKYDFTGALIALCSFQSFWK